MIIKDYILDLSGQSGVPSQWGLTLPHVVALFGKQLNGIDGVQVVEDWRRRGTFEVTAITQEAITFLANFKLKISKEGRSFEIPLKEKSSGKKATWLSFGGTCFGKMATVPNAYFDGVLRECGVEVIKVETRRRYYRGQRVYNGQREALVELGDAHIQRQHTWTDEEGKEHGWWLTYRGQPYSCRKCDGQWHDDGNCPKWVARRRDDNNEGQQKLMVFSTSFLKHAKDTATTRYDCVPGAQIGHIGNHVDNDATILPRAEVIVIAAGQNMGGDDLAVMKEKVKAQGEVLVRSLKDYSEEKKVYIVDPVIGAIPEGSDADESRFLRAEMKRMATSAGGKFVPLDTLNLDNDDMEDEIHLSESGTKRYMTAVRVFVREDIGRDVFGEIATSAKAYAGQRLRHYKVGCGKCTFLHDGPTCPKRSSGISGEGDDATGDDKNGDDDDDDDDDDEEESATKAKELSADNDNNNSINNDTSPSRSSRKKKRKSMRKQQQQQEAMEEDEEESPTPVVDATSDLAAAQAALESFVATPNSELTTSFAAAVLSPSGRKLPAEPAETRARSTSAKRGSDGEQTRSESLKRQKVETELEAAIMKNKDMLANAGMDLAQQNAKWKGLKGVQLLKRQTEMIRQVNTIPNMFKKGGRK